MSRQMHSVTLSAALANSPVPVPAADDYCGTTYAARQLGLSVATVQSLVEEGEIEAWKTRGGHRRISLRSVNQYLQAHGSRSVTALAEPQRRLRVLAVEDDDGARDLYRSVFENWNLATDLTLMGSAMDALMDIASLQPDLLITDVNMPGVDGLEMLRVLKRKQQLAGMRVLVVSGLSREQIDARGGVPPDAQVLTKPVSMEWLHGYVSALLAARLGRG